jgi:hypothetical protein
VSFVGFVSFVKVVCGAENIAERAAGGGRARAGGSKKSPMAVSAHPASANRPASARLRANFRESRAGRLLGAEWHMIGHCRRTRLARPQSCCSRRLDRLRKPAEAGCSCTRPRPELAVPFKSALVASRRKAESLGFARRRTLGRPRLETLEFRGLMTVPPSPTTC